MFLLIIIILMMNNASDFKKNEILFFAMKWMSVGIIILGEISQT